MKFVIRILLFRPKLVRKIYLFLKFDKGRKIPEAVSVSSRTH